MAAAQAGGRSLIVVADTDRAVHVWGLASGAPVGRRIAAHALVVAATQLDGRPVVLSGGSDGTVRMWDPATGAPLGRPLSIDTGTADVPDGSSDPRVVSSVTVALLEGRPVIVAAGWRLVDGDADAIVRVWDLATGAQVGQPLVTADVIDSVAVAEFRGRPVVVVGGSEVLRVCDVATGALLGRSLTVRGQTFDALATGQLDDQPVIVSADVFEIRTWDLAARFG